MSSEEDFAEIPGFARDLPRAHSFVQLRGKSRSKSKFTFSDISCNVLYSAYLRLAVRTFRTVSGVHASTLVEFLEYVDFWLASGFSFLTTHDEFHQFASGERKKHTDFQNRLATSAHYFNSEFR